MRVLVIGANGAIGKQVVQKLKDTEHEPVAMVRDSDQVAYFEDFGAKTVVADLEQNFEKAFDEIDAVIFAAGSGGHTGADKTIIIDQEGAIESTDLAKKFGVQRFMIVSSMGAGNPKEAKQIKHYQYAKHRADEHLKQSGLNYTILRPGGLTNETGTGKVNLQEHISERGTIPREDVAATLVHLLNNSRAENQVFDLLEGETPIENVLD
ncbi:uncharacterized protein YbjT (DUF2867 family) [Virgibacillus halotolerans]|uniref:SDR family oxidoreductase n=1 Tax=Virgibacillus halotolerans TaxID=1071053 RepID=UPI0019619AE7|nr:SDR family oxidoreductase [Virgibacillus halotolerans]MBM7599887.1 uncharacterized protein YbjT (DUF2867 family) [Virgibacillus halotolerans]